MTAETAFFESTCTVFWSTLAKYNFVDAHKRGVMVEYPSRHACKLAWGHGNHHVCECGVRYDS